MTPRQRELARHALGLPNEERVSFGNQYLVMVDDLAYIEWVAMYKAGEATCDKYINCFHLTRASAESVLEPGESLDPEDFPEVANASK